VIVPASTNMPHCSAQYGQCVGVGDMSLIVRPGGFEAESRVLPGRYKHFTGRAAARCAHRTPGVRVRGTYHRRLSRHIAGKPPPPTVTEITKEEVP
jgi:hypothetical protein